MSKAHSATQVGNPILRKSLKIVTKKALLSPSVLDCLASMRSVNNAMKGVGISANQVGYNLRISLIHIKKTNNRPDAKVSPERIMFNPKIIHYPPASEYMWEGCLSVAHADLFVPVLRHKRVKLQYMNIDGVVVEVTLRGLEAHVAQHEVDHLHGVVFLDRDIDKTRYMSSDEYRSMRKKEKERRLESH